MVIIVARPGFRLPFTTVVVHQVKTVHTHRDRFNNAWQEPMTLEIHALAFDMRQVGSASNNNELAA